MELREGGKPQIKGEVGTEKLVIDKMERKYKEIECQICVKEGLEGRTKWEIRRGKGDGTNGNNEGNKLEYSEGR